MRKPRRVREPITEWARLHEAVATGEIRDLWDSIKTEYDHYRNRWRLTGLRKRRDDHA